uniref:Uncharacterized protein n=1 Tax=Rhizophora mucronata TaxID=61149 RepID=A0A2P2Q602_RHIMU
MLMSNEKSKNPHILKLQEVTIRE